jgi:hypothetical protein
VLYSLIEVRTSNSCGTRSVRLRHDNVVALHLEHGGVEWTAFFRSVAAGNPI